MPLEKSAGAIIFRKEAGSDQEKVKYLLLHYEWGHWGLPKGNIEERENIKETAARETEEETGIKDLVFLEGFKEWIKYFYKIEGENRFKIVTYLLAETKQEEVNLSHEHTDYKWLPYKEALEKLTHKNTKEILKKANDFIKSN